MTSWPAATLALAALATPVEGGQGLSFQETSGLRLMCIIMFFILISEALEHTLHQLHHLFFRTKRVGLTLTLKKLEEELMLLGFCSLVLLAFEDKVCLRAADPGRCPHTAAAANCLRPLTTPPSDPAHLRTR